MTSSINARSSTLTRLSRLISLSSYSLAVFWLATRQATHVGFSVSSQDVGSVRFANLTVHIGIRPLHERTIAACPASSSVLARMTWTGGEKVQARLRGTGTGVTSGWLELAIAPKPQRPARKSFVCPSRTSGIPPRHAAGGARQCADTARTDAQAFTAGPLKQRHQWSPQPDGRRHTNQLSLIAPWAPAPRFFLVSYASETSPVRSSFSTEELTVKAGNPTLPSTTS